ncbi:MAG: MerR family transcriptional regulator [Paucilactobacillus nenjiangensis]
MIEVPTQLKEVFDQKMMQFGIGDLSRVTQVSQSKLRYWESKGYIHPIQIQTGQNRKYSMATLSRVRMIKYFLDEGYTLPVAVKKANEQKETISVLRKVMVERFVSIDEIDGKPAVNMGPVEDQPGKKLVAIVDLDGVTMHLVDDK